MKKSIFLNTKTLWNKLTTPHATDKADARNEYAVKVIIGISTIICGISTPLLIAARLMAPQEVTLDMPILSGIFTILFFVGWMIAYRGYWRFGSYIPPAFLFGLALIDTYRYGIGATNIMEYTIAIVITALLHPGRSWWIVSILAVASGLLLELRAETVFPDTGIADLIYWAVLIVAYVVLITLLLRFLVEQYRKTIVEHERTEQRLTESLKRNEVLLRELFHRTKNNMQLICSYLDIQTSFLEDPALRNSIKEIENKIQSMALVHHMIYESQDLSKINMRTYLYELACLLLTNYGADPHTVSIDFETEDVFVLIDTAIPAGLIVTELMSNSLKHAFPDNRSGTIRIILFRDKEKSIHLGVEDNGIGTPDHFDFRADGSLGLSLLFTLVETQLSGSVTFESGEGLSCRITFKDDIYTARV